MLMECQPVKARLRMWTTPHSRWLLVAPVIELFVQDRKPWAHNQEVISIGDLL